MKKSDFNLICKNTKLEQQRLNSCYLCQTCINTCKNSVKTCYFYKSSINRYAIYQPKQRNNTKKRTYILNMSELANYDQISERDKIKNLFNK
jgi:hypothetical protein